MRGELAWSEMMVEWVLIESLSRDPVKVRTFLGFGDDSGSGGF